MRTTIARRFCGPPESANGGWVCGLLAGVVTTTAAAPAVTVRLSSPPPLERPLELERTGEGGAVLRDGDHVVATAVPAPAPTGHLPDPVRAADARRAATAYEGLAGHPFPTCFSCGTAREPGDGLALRPGPLADGTGRYAAPWVPLDVDLPVVWAALDCPGGWAAGIAGRPMVLGTMTALVAALPRVGEEHVLLAWQRSQEGRKHLSGSALLTADGQVLARAQATWLAVDPTSVRPREPR
ncbi:MAG TPA: hypothetical protein VES95_02670 [Dermatophilaceae bacterium]|nr:hypothetical protein [Dermatophilaceae bacterium]